MVSQEIGQPDDDGFFMFEKAFRLPQLQSRTSVKIIASILIIAGSISLISGVINNLWQLPWINQEILNYFNNTVRNNLIPVIVSLVLIIVGFKLLKGAGTKKADRNTDGINIKDALINKDGDQS